MKWHIKRVEFASNRLWEVRHTGGMVLYFGRWQTAIQWPDLIEDIWRRVGAVPA